MKWQEIEDALEELLGSSSGEFEAGQMRFADATDEYRTAMVSEELVQRMAPILAAALELNGELEICTPAETSAFDVTVIARMLISRARKGGSIADAVTWLQKALTTRTATGVWVMVLWGINLTEPVPLLSGVELVPFDSWRASRQKTRVAEWFNPLNGSLLGPRTSSLWGQPRTALIYHVKMDPFLRIKDGTSAPDPNRQLESYYIVERISSVLTLAGPRLILQAATWFELDEPDPWGESLSSGIMSSHMEVIPLQLPSFGMFEPARAAQSVKGYFTAPDALRARVSVSLERLSLAMRRRTPGDQALDVSIAFEALLLSEEKGDNTFQVALRAALIVTRDMQERRRVRAIVKCTYEMRSDMVHRGICKPDVKVAGIGKLPAIQVARDAIVICATLIEEVLKLGRLPVWEDIELGASG